MLPGRGVLSRPGFFNPRMHECRTKARPAAKLTPDQMTRSRRGGTSRPDKDQASENAEAAYGRPAKPAETKP